MGNNIAELITGLVGIIPVAALISYGYALLVRTVHEIRFQSIGSAYARDSAGSWIHAVTESISRESFWHSLFSASLVRTIPAPVLYTAVSFRSLLSAAELLALFFIIRIVPPLPVYALFAASFVLRILHRNPRQSSGTLLAGMALFMFPLLHPNFFDASLRLLKEGEQITARPLYTLIFALLLFLAARKQVGTTALISLLLLLGQTGKISSTAIPVLSLAIFAGSNESIRAWIRNTNRKADEIPRILLLETAILAIGTLLAGFVHPSGGCVTAAAVLCLTAVMESAVLYGKWRTRQFPRTVLSDPLDAIEANGYQICGKSEYAVTLVRIMLGCTSDSFSRLRLMVRDIQNAGTLMHETRTIRTAITREETAIRIIDERIEKAIHILMNHHRDSSTERMLDTVLHISRYTGRIAGKIVNLAEYFDRLRKKNAFFSAEESMEVTELLAMTNDIAGYVSDYLAGLVHNMDPAALSGMEEQLRSDSIRFKRDALLRLQKSGATSVRTNLAFIETIETIRSMLHYLDRISVLAGSIDHRYI